MRRMVRGVVGLVVVLGLVGAGLAFYYFNYSPDRTIHPLRGIDVSHHQGVVDWGRVAKSDVAFAILKATMSTKLSRAIWPGRRRRGSWSGRITSSPFAGRARSKRQIS